MEHDMGKHSRAPRPRRARFGVVGIVLALLVSTAIVWQSSHANFTSKTVNPGNSFSAGSVLVTDNKNGTALFSLTGLRPGDSGDQCIQVTYQGTLTGATINFYVDNYADNSTAGAWGTAIKLTVTTGGGTCPVGSITGASTPIVDKTLPFLNTTYDYPAGSSMYAWNNPATNAIRPYNIHYQVLATLADDGTGGIQGKTASLDLVWEAVS
jgi:hypothetical protein